MNLSEFEDSKFYVGLITELDFKTWIVNFKVPGIIDNMDEYPKATPLFCHTYQLSVGDEIFIIKPTKIQNDIFFYLPITIYKQIGMWYFNNIIDLTNDGLISVSTNDMVVKLKNAINIEIGNCKISISKNGNVNINGNLEVSGKLSSTSGGNGVIVSLSGDPVQYEGGVII